MHVLLSFVQKRLETCQVSMERPFVRIYIFTSKNFHQISEGPNMSVEETTCENYDISRQYALMAAF